MKILHITPYFYPAWAYGGPPRAAYELCKELVKRGHEVTVYTTDTLDAQKRVYVPSKEALEIDGIKVYYFRNLSNRLAGRYHLFITPTFVKAVRHNLKGFDVIHLYGARTTLHISTYHYAKKYGVPYILRAAGGILPFGTMQGFKRLFDMLFGYRILKDAAKVIAGNEVEIDEHKRMGVDEDKITIISPAYDIDAFSHPPAFGQFRKKFGIKEKHIILFLGRIHKIKGIDFLAESFHELAQYRDDVALAIAGPDDGYQTALESLVRKLDLSTRVLFTGFLDGEDKLSALVDATMLVQTSIYERGPGSPFEAILCNTPIIVTRDTGCGEIVAEVDAGYLVQYGNVKELTNAMQKILDNPAEATSKAQKAKEYIIANLSYEKMVEEYERLYESVVLSKRGG